MKVSVVVLIILYCSCISLACKCDWHGLHTAVEEDIVIAVDTTDVIEKTDREITYDVLVLQVFKGKNYATAGHNLKVVTASVPEACGQILDVPQTYLLTGSMVDDNTVQIHSCGYNVPFTRISAADEKFLDNLYDTNTNECATGMFEDCFVEPCSVSTCNVNGAVCENNYCNGCNAYWWSNDWTLVCLPQN